jgi:CRP-like cAMP-binding protein
MFEFFRPPAIMKRALTPTELHEHARKYFEEVINNSLSSKLAKMDNVRRLARFDNPMRARADTMLEEKITDLDETEGKPLAYHLQDRVSKVFRYSAPNSHSFNQSHLLSDCLSA